MSTEIARPYVKKELLDKAKEKFPECQGLDASALVDFLIRKLLET